MRPGLKLAKRSLRRAETRLTLQWPPLLLPAWPALITAGVGGYGGHMIVAPAGGKSVHCIDFNTAAPAAARADMYPFNEKGEVIGAVNRFGWLASGVPGTLAGLQMALERHGTRGFGEVVQPAIRLAT